MQITSPFLKKVIVNRSGIGSAKDLAKCQTACRESNSLWLQIASLSTFSFSLKMEPVAIRLLSLTVDSQERLWSFPVRLGRESEG